MIANLRCRGLFERHKLLLSLQMCVRILQSASQINNEEWQFFLKGGMVLDRSQQAKNPAPAWLSELAWDNITELDSLASFKVGLCLAAQLRTARGSLSNCLVGLSIHACKLLHIQRDATSLLPLCRALWPALRVAQGSGRRGTGPSSPSLQSCLGSGRQSAASSSV